MHYAPASASDFTSFNDADLDRSIPDYLERIVARYAHKTALHTRTEQLTYQEWNQRANRAARYFLSLRPSCDEPIALMFGHGAAAMVALFAALKTSKPYVVLDPTYPAERLRYTMEKMGAGLLIHDLQHAAQARQVASLQGIRACMLEEAGAELSSENLGLIISPDRPSYVIFTSGSTGKPKGAIVNHRIRTVGHREFTNRLRLCPSDRFSALHSIAFSAAGPEFYGGLMAGATVYPLDVRREGFGGLQQWMLEQRITVFQWIASAVRRFFADLPSNFRFPDLRLIVLGSEPVTPRDIELCRQHVPEDCLIVNRYGTTECGNTHYFVMDRGVRVTGATVPVGYSAHGRHIEILDAVGNVLPPGEIGEIAVTSTYLSPGYWGEPELTAAAYEHLPHTRARRYRTGDLGRLTPDGCLDHLGRKDAQVKIRGHRIELVEVEAVLLTVAGVRDAAVVAWPDPQGELRLTAYVAPAPDSRLSADALRDALAAHLPAYMVPQAFTFLDALPLTATGKVQRTALPPPSWGAPEVRVGHQPVSDLQRTVATLIAEVLERDRVGLDEDFFALGGDSLRGAQVVSRLQQLLGQHVSPTLLFDCRTARRAAAQLETPDHAPALTAIPRLPEDSDSPLSFAQQRLWFLDRLEPTSVAYNEPLLLELSGDLNLFALRHALDEIVRRHEVLRSTFPLLDDGPVQRVEDPAPVPLPVIDLTVPPEVDQGLTGREIIAETVSGRFDLERGPLLRAKLLRTGDTRHLLVLVVHHIAIDGLSFDLLLQELGVLYRGSEALPPLPVQYRDFAAWQRNRDFPAADLQYWTERLHGIPPLELPTDFPRPLRPRHEGLRQNTMLPATLSAAISQLAASEQATPFMVLLSAFALLLGRWCRTEELVIGAPLADRPHPDTESLIGVFLNNLSLRVDLSGNPTFRELLARVRGASVEAYAHQQVPFERVVDAMQLERDTSRHPIFEVSCNHLSAAPLPEFPGLIVQRRPADHPPAKLPITLYSGMREGRLRLSLVYQTDLFHPGRMSTLLQQLEHVLRQATDAPKQPLQSFSLVTDADRDLLPDPAAPMERPQFESVVHTFLTRAALKPSESAIVHGDLHWSYERLADAMESIAARLADESGRAVIAVTGPRRPELVAAILGVLRSGRVLLTLDPTLPRARRELMLRECDCRLVLTVTKEAARDLPEVAVVDVETLVRQSGARGARETPPGLPSTKGGVGEGRGVTPAYVFFTSGSTGTPKAVLGTHEGLAHFIAWQRETFEIGRGDRCAQLTSLAFDVLLRDLFLPLTTGGAICLPAPTDLETGTALFSWLRETGVTTLHLVPSLARHWLAGARGAASLPSLRHVFFSGEPLTEALVETWRSEVSHSAAVMNLYGATETTMVKFCYRVPELPLPGAQPAGHPLPQTQGLILSPTGRRCALYEPGEIVVRTPFRTLGYLNASVEDAARWAPNPFHAQPDPDDLLYFTGDLGYLQCDGSLVTLGRLDHQVKINGVRIEPGEVEAALLRHPGIREAAVIGQRSPRGERLVAYVVAEGPGVDPGALRRFLAETLPPALVPAWYVSLDRLPLNTSGKLDRARLPLPESQSAREQTAVGPRDELERRLLAVWAEVLRVPVAGIHDDFFALGGHSLLAVQLLVRVQREVGRTLPLASIMHAPTVAGLADLLRVESTVAATGVLVPIQPRGSRPPLFAVHGIGGGVLCYRELSAALGDEQPFYGLQAPALGGEAHEHLSVEQMAERYLQVVRQVQPAGPYRFLGLSFGGNIALEMAQQLLRAGEQVALLGLLDSKGPGYPRFPGRLPRAKAHVSHFLNLEHAQRGQYLRVRATGLRDLTRRRILVRWYDHIDRSEETLPRLLEDIGISHLRAAREYRRQPYPGRITLFKAEHQPIGCIPEWDNGWSRISPDVAVHPVPGEHATMLDPPHVSALAAAFTDALGTPS